jgi:hypothetical protein
MRRIMLSTPLVVSRVPGRSAMAGAFLDQDCALNGLDAPGGIAYGLGNEIYLKLFHVAVSTLLGLGGLEMIAGHIGSQHFYISNKGVRTLLFETAEDTRAIGAEFEVGFLDEVVDGPL